MKGMEDSHRKYMTASTLPARRCTYENSKIDVGRLFLDSNHTHDKIEVYEFSLFVGLHKT